MIYEFITARGKLTDEHRGQLRDQRGFSNEIITAHRFFSGGKYLAEHSKEILETFTEEELLSSGVFVKPERSPQMVMSPQLLEDRIIIPYLDKNNKSYFIRPHKMGLEAPVQIYHERILQREEPHAILTESEFKAVAGEIFGFRTIGIPGIGSFADTHFPRLVAFLQKCKIRQICILYDNEIKDNPAFPNYKDEPFKRFDTEYFAYLMGINLLREGIETRIGRLPDSWRVNGKIDLDGALAQKRTTDEIKSIIAESKTPKAYIEDLPTEAKNIVNRKLTKKFYRSHISTSWGKYVAVRRQGKQEWEEIISNFTMKVIARHETSEGVVREVVLVDEYGKHSRSFPLPSEPMVKRDAFANFVMSKGNFIWTGNNDDLANIWRGLFLDDDGRHIIEPDHIGWVDDERIFLFGNMAVGEDGAQILPDKHNIFWREKYGLKPVPISTSSGRSAISEGIPMLSTTAISLHDIQSKFIESIGKYEAYTIMGWAASVLFMEEVFDSYNCFPFLFITGRRGSGKSTIAEWIMNFFGIETGGKMASDTTAVAMQRYLSYYSSLPVFIDEYRNTKNVTIKNGFLRNVYNRQSAGKGVKAAFGVREGKVRGTLLVSGEETPDDNALLTRCVVINVKEKQRLANHFNWFQNHRAGLSYFAYHVLSRKKAIVKQYIENLHDGKTFFVQKGLDDRMAINYSVIGSGYGAIFGDIPSDFQDYLSAESQKVKSEYDKEHAMQVFWEDILALQSTGRIRDEVWSWDNDHYYLYFGGLYAVWAAEHRSVHGTEPFKAGAIRKYMEEEPGFVEFGVQKKIGKYNRRCVVFKKDQAPAELVDLIERPPESMSE